MLSAHHGDHAAGLDAVAHAHHALVVGVVSPLQEELVAHVVGAVVHHEAAALHLAGLTPAQVGRHVSAVAAALIGTTLEVLVLEEHHLQTKAGGSVIHQSSSRRHSVLHHIYTLCSIRSTLCAPSDLHSVLHQIYSLCSIGSTH